MTMETRRIYYLICLCWFNLHDISNCIERKGVNIGFTCKHDTECNAGNGGEYSKCNKRLSICICTVNLLGDDKCKLRDRPRGRVCRRKPLYTEEKDDDVCALECSAKWTWPVSDDMDWNGQNIQQFSSIFIPDKKTSVCYDPERAMNSVPNGFTINTSSIPDAGQGVFTEVYIKRDTVFGPYKGILDFESGSDYSWLIHPDESRKETMWIDGSDKYLSNWLRYMNTPISSETENILSVQYKGQVYYIAMKNIPPGTELFVWYGVQYTRNLGIKEFKRSKFEYAESEYAGGLCANDGEPCQHDANTICVWELCLCTRGSTLRARFCILDETLGGVCSGLDGETCKQDNRTECLRGICVCKNSTSPANGICIPDECVGGRCSSPNGQTCKLDSNAECTDGLCYCKFGTSIVEQICIKDGELQGTESQSECRLQLET